MKLSASLAGRIPLIESAISGEFERFYASCPSNNLRAGIHYALSSGGKRIRPLLTWLCYGACSPGLSRPGLGSGPGCDGNPPQNWIPAAMAVEWVHTYSLIHDDLPAMDDDDERRGKPSLHRKFDEATAILTGDALLSDAFAIISKSAINAPDMCRELSMAIGSCGMVAGQDLDLNFPSPPVGEGRPHGNADGERGTSLNQINALKTGKLFEAACVLGGLSRGADEDGIQQLREFGRLFGLLFQWRDDQLDNEQPFELNILSLKLSITNCLDALPGNTQELRDLVQFCESRVI